MNNICPDRRTFATSIVMGVHLLYACIIAFFLLGISIANAGLFDNCVFSYDFGDSSSSQMTVYPIGSNCFTNCGADCVSKFAQPAASGGVLNLDIISQCQAACQTGASITTQYKQATTTPTLYTMNQWTLMPAVTVSSGCSSDPTNPNSAAYNFYDSGVLVGPDNQVSVRLNMAISDPAYNTLYLCGSQTVDIYPAFYSLQPSIWQSQSQSWSIGSQGPNETTTISTWSAKNPYWTDTGIMAQDGDFVAITFGGPYIMNCNSTGCSPTPEADNLDIARGANQTVLGGVQVLPGEQLLTMNLPNCQSLTTNADINSCLQSATANTGGMTPGEIAQNNAGVKIMGLTGSAYGGIFPSSIESIQGSPVFKVATFAGTLAGFSPSPASLLIRHHDVGNMSKWANHVGGKHVTMLWQGCPISGGANLQYAIVPPDPTTSGASSSGTGGLANSVAATYTPSATSDWQDVPADYIKNNTPLTLDLTKNGKLFFRIKPLGPFQDSQNGSVDARKAVGQYKFVVSVSSLNQDSVMGYVDQIVQTISSYFFGPDGSSGIVQTIFNDIVANSNIVLAIKAFLVLYVTFTGLSFMIGTAQMTHQELLIRVFKIAFVLVLLNDGWAFCSTYLFPLFTKGMIEIMTIMYTDPDVDPLAMAKFKQGNTYAIFYNLDRPVTQMLFGPSGTGIKGTGLLGGPTWHKVQALCLSTLFGPLLGAAIIVGSIFYAMAIFKAVMVFLLSLIGIAIMLMTAPLFISLILFAKTREIFDSWTKLLMSFSFQPIMVFGMLGIMGKLLLMTFYVSLWFTACEACWMSLKMPQFGVDTCFFKAYFTMNSAFAGSSYFVAPISSISVVIAFLLIAFASYSMIDVMCSLATQIITGAYYGVHLGGMAVKANPFTKAADLFEGIMGSAIQGPMAKRRDALVKAGEKRDAKEKEREDRKDWDALIKYSKAKEKHQSAEDERKATKEQIDSERAGAKKSSELGGAGRAHDYMVAQTKLDEQVKALPKKAAQLYPDDLKAQADYIKSEKIKIKSQRVDTQDRYETKEAETREQEAKSRENIEKEQDILLEKKMKAEERAKEEREAREADLKERNDKFQTADERQKALEERKKEQDAIKLALDQKKKADEEADDLDLDGDIDDSDD